MARLLLRSQGVVRHLASIKVTHDGTVKLNLVREGSSDEGFQWSVGDAGASAVTKLCASESKTKSISIHTSGRVNYHFGGGSRRFVPCLMDLEYAVPIVTYSIPGVGFLDAISTPRQDDWLCEIPPDLEHRLVFSFVVLPAVLPALPGEIGRIGIEGIYAMAWSAESDPSGLIVRSLPGAVFTTSVPGDSLPAQAAREEEVYLRFRRAMYANDIAAAVEKSPNRDEITEEQIEAMVQAGPGLYPPNGEGIWTLLTSVPMRIAPKLAVTFEDDRYRAEVVELRSGDTRLETVRVRFRVFDERTKVYVKSRVAIRSVALDARL